MKRRGGRRCFVASAAVLWIGVHATACSRSPAPPPNILLVVVDTLRADRLGAYGSRLGLTPFLDSLAERSYVFRRAYAQSSWTSPSIASLLTSRYQWQHGVVSFQSVMRDQERTLPEVLAEHGYATGAFTANFLLRPGMGFAQGYDRYRMIIRKLSPGEPLKSSKERVEQVGRSSLAWLRNLARAGRTEPVFLYLHFMEPHNPYHPPDDLLDEIVRRRGRGRPDRDKINDDMTRSNFVRYDDDEARAVEDLYDAEVASIDRGLRRLIEKLRAPGLLGDPIIVVTADHGEELNEHGWLGHGKTLFEEVIRVPLLVSLPGQKRRVDVTRAARLIDVAPTLLATVGVPIPASFEGRPLLRDETWPGSWLAKLRRLWSGPPGGRRGVLAELLESVYNPRQSPHRRAVILGSHKLIAGVGGEREYYDLDADPAETNPEGLDPALRADLDDVLERWEREAAAPTPAATEELDADTKERMRALGYAD